MQFRSIREVIEKTGANAKAADCLGKSGAFNTLEEELNEIEAANYAKEIVNFLRDQNKYKERLLKYEKSVETKEEQFRKRIEERRIKQEAKDAKYEERVIEYEKKLRKVQKENKERFSKEKKLLKEPKKPVVPALLKEINYPNLSREPDLPPEPIKPKVVLSTRERIKLERQMLHIYLSGHPLDEVPEKRGITEIKKLSREESGSWETIRGVLQSLKATQTRTKKLMGRLRIEDKTGSIEVVAFPRLYGLLKETLVEGELYEVNGRVDVTKRESNKGEEFIHTQFIGTKVRPIRIGSDKEWDMLYPLLKGSIRILPSKIQKSKGIATMIITSRARKLMTEENIEQL